MVDTDKKLSVNSALAETFVSRQKRASALLFVGIDTCHLTCLESFIRLVTSCRLTSATVSYGGRRGNPSGRII